MTKVLNGYLVKWSNVFKSEKDFWSCDRKTTQGPQKSLAGRTLAMPGLECVMITIKDFK